MTLLELVVVLTVMGLAASFVLPKFERWLGVEEGFRGAFVSSIKEASALALARGERVHFEIDPVNRTYGIRGGKRKQIPPGVEIWAEGGIRVEGLYVISFFADGSATATNLTVIEGKEAFSVIVDPVLGRVRVVRR